MPARPKALNVSIAPSATAAHAAAVFEASLEAAGFDSNWQTIFGLALGLLAGISGFDTASELDTSGVSAGPFRDGADFLFEQLRVKVGAARASELACEILATIRASAVSVDVR